MCVEFNYLLHELMPPTTSPYQNEFRFRVGEDLRTFLSGRARIQVALGKLEGHTFDRKMIRFNDIVAGAMNYGRCGKFYSVRAAIDGLDDCVAACIVDDPMYVKGSGPAEAVYDWMSVSEAPT